jgi:hypothetical protein
MMQGVLFDRDPNFTLVKPARTTWGQRRGWCYLEKLIGLA